MKVAVFTTPYPHQEVAALERVCEHSSWDHLTERTLQVHEAAFRD
jgi:tRNA(Arg) A34 adenosine deaminase TadA